MIKTLKTILLQDKEKYRVPKKIQDVIPIKCMWEDGIFKTGNRYSKSYCFTDINYRVASDEDKQTMSKSFQRLINSLDCGVPVKFTVFTHSRSSTALNGNAFLPLAGDDNDVYRTEINNMITDKAYYGSGMNQERIITISVHKPNIEAARVYFNRIDRELSLHFSALGSKCAELTGSDRIRILHDFYRPEDTATFAFNAKEMIRRGHDFRDFICPDSMEHTKNHLKLGNTFARTMFLKDYASSIDDTLISELSNLNSHMMVSLDIVTVPQEEGIRVIENKLLAMDTEAANFSRRQIANNNYTADPPFNLQLRIKSAKEILDKLSSKDERMTFGTLTLVITADSLEQLDTDTEAVIALAQSYGCQMATFTYQQIDGLNTVLPIGSSRVIQNRTLTTESLSAFIPFNVQEIMDEGGMYYGVNAISHNLILCNKAKLINQSSFLLGIPGSGKSFMAKLNIILLLLGTQDDIFICDPEGEYGPLLKAMGDMCSVIHIAAGGKDRLNAMYMVDGYGDSNPVVVKSQFIMSLVEQIDKKGVGPQHKSIIDRCVASVYREAEITGITPTLCTLREKLLEQPEPESKQIALALELYTTGSLDIFGHSSNVDLDKRVLVFDIHGLGSQLKPAGLLVITDTILNRVTLNWKKGKRTHVFIDEFHVVFENEYSAAFFTSAWRQFRKRNAYPTAITQNVEYLLDSVQASTMLSNSEFIVMLNQAAPDREKLARLLSISPEQMSYITDVEPGCGLIKYGSTLVPFINKFPKDTKLYELMTTKPGEGVFAGAANDDKQ